MPVSVLLINGFTNPILMQFLAHLPGQDSGYAVTDILYERVSSSGKFLYTVAENESDYDAVFVSVNYTGWDRYFP